jgi:hypothetical protein
MSISLQEFVRKTIDEVNSALPKGYVIEDAIDFELSVTTTNTRNGGIEIKVLSGKVEKENQTVQSVYFSVINEKDKAKSEKNSINNILKSVGKGLKSLSKISEKTLAESQK